MRIAVTGGTGFVGSHVVELLLERGHELSCLVLPSEGRLWAEGLPVAFHEGSVGDPGSLLPFLEGCDAIVHVAGLTRSSTEEGFVAVNVAGAANVARAALSLSPAPRHMIAMSSLAAVGPCPLGSCLDEDAPLRPLTSYGRSKAAMEAELGRLGDRLPMTFIRAPAVYGPRDRDILEYFKLVRRGLRVIVGARNVMSLLYVKNLALAIADMLLEPAAFNQAFFLADEGEWDWDQLCEEIEASLGVRARRVHVPEWVVAAAAGFVELARPFLRKAPLLSREKLVEMRQERWVVSTEKARRLFGYRPGYSMRDAIAETARWYEAEGWI